MWGRHTIVRYSALKQHPCYALACATMQAELERVMLGGVSQLPSTGRRTPLEGASEVARRTDTERRRLQGPGAGAGALPGLVCEAPLPPGERAPGGPLCPRTAPRQ